MINRCDLRVLSEGWYLFSIKEVVDCENQYGPGIKVTLSVGGGERCGSCCILTLDRCATPGNKTGRFLRVLGFDPGVELPVQYGEIIGRRLGGRVVRYESSGRTKCKVVEFCPPEKVRELLEHSPTALRGIKDGGF